MTISEACRILGVAESDSGETLKDRRRLLVLAWHPDRFANDQEMMNQAQEELKKINVAYDLMTKSHEGRSETKDENDGAEADSLEQCTSCGARCKPAQKAPSQSLGNIGEQMTVYRVRAPKASPPSLLLTYLDNEDNSNPWRYHACSACACCFICYESLRSESWIEVRKVDAGPAGRDWVGTSYTRAHEACFEGFVEARRAEEANSTEDWTDVSDTGDAGDANFSASSYWFACLRDSIRDLGVLALVLIAFAILCVMIYHLA